MSELNEVPEDAEWVEGVRPGHIRDSHRVIAETEDGDVYNLGRNPDLYVERVGWPDDE